MTPMFTVTRGTMSLAPSPCASSTAAAASAKAWATSPGQRRLEGCRLVEIEDEARRELRGARRQVRVGSVGAPGLERELEPEGPFLTKA